MRRLLQKPDLLNAHMFTVGNMYVVKGRWGNGLIVVADNGHYYIVLESRFE